MERQGEFNSNLKNKTNTVCPQAVDRHFKLPHASTKPMRTAGGMGEPAYKTLRFALRAALKTAIYRITTTFGDHLKWVALLLVPQSTGMHTNIFIFAPLQRRSHVGRAPQEAAAFPALQGMT